MLDKMVDTGLKGNFMAHRWQGWSDGIQTWKAFRIPRNANTNPEYLERVMSFDLGLHAEGIGMTGWDWKNRQSLWVAFDFDAITGHSDEHQKRLNDDEIADIEKSLDSIEWVTLRRSTGGRGLHLYVYLEPISTSNHTEHAALARAILGKLSSLTKINLETKVDICGQNMWVWHRKMTKENRGLEVLKKGIKLKEIPLHWKDHIKVISGHRKKTLPRFLGENDSQVERVFDDLVNQLTRISLDEDHKKLILYLEEKGSGSWWDVDHNMLVTHTYWLAKAHHDLMLKGKFETDSAGTDAPADVNSYAFPIRRGGWSVRRYSLGVSEHDSWEQDGRGWTQCYYNTDPTLSSAARALGAVEDPSGGFVFDEASIAMETLQLLGANLRDLPPALSNKKI